MINDTRVRCFLKLAETHSFTETAKALYMTQQGVSKHISQIESEFGFTLFVRSNSGATLTAAGQNCYEMISRFVEEYDTFLRDEREKAVQNRNELRIGFQHWLELGAAPVRALSDLQKEAPMLVFSGERYSPGILRRKFEEDELDIILIHRRFSPSGDNFESTELGRVPMALFVSQDHPKSIRGADYSSFAGENLLIDTLAGETREETMARALREAQMFRLNPSRVLILPNRDSVYTAVEMSHGVAIGNATVNMHGTEKLTQYRSDMTETILCIWRKGRKLPERYAELLTKKYREIYPQK